MIKGNSKSFVLQVIIAILIVITISGHYTPLLAEECGRHIKNGDNYYEQFENSEALSEFEKAYEICPDQFEPLMKLTRAYNDVGEDLRVANSNGSKPKDAEKYFKRAVAHSNLLKAKYPNDIATFFLLAVSHGNLSLFKGGKQKVKYGKNVEEYAKKAIQLDPNFAPSYVVLGIYYREVAGISSLAKAFANTLFGGLPDGTLEDSEGALLKALELSPDSPYVHFDLAETYEEMDKQDKALEHYNKVVELPMVDHDDKRKKEISERRIKKLNNPETPKSDKDLLMLRKSE